MWQRARITKNNREDERLPVGSLVWVKTPASIPLPDRSGLGYASHHQGERWVIRPDQLELLPVTMGEIVTALRLVREELARLPPGDVADRACAKMGVSRLAFWDTVDEMLRELERGH